MYHYELKICHHAVFVKRWVGTSKINFASICHFMHDLSKDAIDPMRTFKSKSHINEETFFWYNGINGVLACKWTIDCFHMNEPINVSAFWSFFKYRVNDIRIDI